VALVLASVFVPTAFIPGITGRLYQQFAVTIAVSVMISAFNALTLSPALCALLLRRRQEHKGPIGRCFDWFNTAFRQATNAYVRVTALFYGIIGIFHYVFRKKFLLISMDPEAAEKQGMSIRFWDFLFYASFGFVVTSSVAIAGVLLVFCYLIVPSVGAMLFAKRIGPRLAIGWTMGTLVSALGVYLSLQIDLPTGATIVCTFGIVLILMAACRVLVRRKPA
jgi:ABC-type Fe3+-siderophore transport system permease subunit